MHGRILTSSLVVVVSLLAACDGKNPQKSDTGTVALAGTPKTDKAADEANLRAVYQKMPQQLMTGDIAGVTALFADDGMEVMNGMAPAKGRDAAQKALTAAFSPMKNLQASMGEVTVTIAESGDLAVVQAPYRVTFTDAKGKKAEDHGTSLTVFKKIDGQWRILYDTSVSDATPASS